MDTMAKVSIFGKFDGQKYADNLRETIQNNLGKIISDEVTRMKIRTTQGRDYENNQFADYSLEYKRFKAEKTKKQVSVPDLTFSGDMLKAITQEVIPKGNTIEARIFFASAREAAKASGNLKTRKFFGFSKEQFERITVKLKQAIRG